MARLGFLKSVFADEIDKIDSGFFVRLEESKFYLEDRSKENQQKFALFADEDFTDKEYFQKYPTVFHLRKAIIENDGSQVFDVRLVYLAISSLYKRRGHFLNDLIDDEDRGQSFKELIDELNIKLDGLDVETFVVDGERLEEILSEKGVSKSKILENVTKYMKVEGLKVGSVTEKDSIEDKGTIIDQSVRSGMKANKGTAINLTVSSGSGAQKTGHVYITLPNTGDTHTLRVYVANELQKSSDVLLNGRGYTAEISGNGTDVPVDIYIGETKVYDAKADFTRSTVPLTDVHTYPYASESTTSANGGFILPW